MQKLLVVQWFEQWWLKPETLSSILVRSGVSLSFYFPHKMFVAAKINFVGGASGMQQLIISVYN